MPETSPVTGSPTVDPDGNPAGHRWSVTGDGLLGRTEAREFTAPLRPLTRETSLGYELADFADLVLGEPLMPWQRWLAIHALELNPDGSLRFRTVVVLVARQNGKSHFARVLALYTMFMRDARLVLGTAQNLDIARVLWQSAGHQIISTPELSQELTAWNTGNGRESITLHGDRKYRIVAANESAGRGLTVDLLLLDEIRQQHDMKAWSALSKTTAARPNSQIWAISNAGDNASVVLNQLEERAKTGRAATMGFFGWTAHQDREMDDPDGWCEANPAAGFTLSRAYFEGALDTDTPATFRTEVLCQRVDALDSAVSMDGWRACADATGTMPRELVTGGLDVSPDGQHVTLVAAAQTLDDRIRIEVVEAWRSVDDARRELADWIRRVGFTAIGWYPAGPAAPLGADLRRLKKVDVVELTGAHVTEACQELAELVVSRRILHSSDALLDAHVAGSRKKVSGDGWRFVRRGAGHVDAAYAAAGAVHVLRNLPEPKPVIIPRAV